MPKVTFLTFVAVDSVIWWRKPFQIIPKMLSCLFWDGGTWFPAWWVSLMLFHFYCDYNWLWIRTDKWTKCTKLLENSVFFQHVLEGIVQKSCFFTENMLFSFSMLTIIQHNKYKNMIPKQHGHKKTWFSWNSTFFVIFKNPKSALGFVFLYLIFSIIIFCEKSYLLV